MVKFLVENQELIINIVIVIASILCPSPLQKILSAVKNAKSIKKEIDEFRGSNGQKRN